MSCFLFYLFNTLFTVASRGVNRAGKGREINRAGEGIVRAGYGNKKKGFLMPPYPLTNFEIQK